MSVNNDNFVIEIKDIELAQNAASSISDSNIRNRAVANILAAELASKYFTDADININSCMHNVLKILKDIDISDVYIKGNYIDVRIYFDDDKLYVPKSHFDFGMLPVAYMFIKLDKDLSAGNVTGFVFPEDIDIGVDVGGYYQVSEDVLRSFYDIEQRIVITDDDGIDTSFKENVYDFLDGKISGRNIYGTLALSEIAREFLITAANADSTLHSLNIEKIESDVSAEDLVQSETKAEPESEVLHESEENIGLETVDDIELLNQVDSETDELMEIDDDGLQVGTDELLESLETEDNDILINEDIENDELLLNHDSNEPDILEQNLPSENLTEREVLSEESSADVEETTIITEEPVDNENSPVNSEIEELEIDDEPHLVENMNFSSEYETSGQLAKSPSNYSQLKPQFVVYNDEPVQNKTIKDEDEFSELSKFDYSTEIMPSISSIESGNQASEPVTEEMLTSADSINSANSYEEQQDSEENKEQIENLFGTNPHKAVNTSNKKGTALPFLTVLILLGALGYWGYTKYYSPVPDVINNTSTGNNYEKDMPVTENEKPKEDAMPVETVENTQVPKSKDEAAAVSIPAIEQNLNASIDVSNLSVNWEVPLSYANNSTAKRYFVKIGKILQLNLKTEMLFLSSSPITNKISIELEFDKNSNKFVISKFINSSGVVVIDNTIKETVEKALNMNLNTNMSVFKNLQGSPVLVIKL